MKYLPKILLYSRLVSAIYIIFLGLNPSVNNSWQVILLMYTGIIGDIFDGIIARKLEISTASFRLLDTLFDLGLYLSIFFYIFNYAPSALNASIKLVLTILTIELGMYLVSWFKFNKLPSPHAIASKFWGIYLVIEFTLLLLNIPGNHFKIALFIGTLVHLDRLLIYIFLQKWDHDIPSSYHAYQIKQGKTLTRNKLFNG
jgi:phosphatidylserine synthase